MTGCSGSWLKAGMVALAVAGFGAGGAMAQDEPGGEAPILGEPAEDQAPAAQAGPAAGEAAMPGDLGDVVTAVDNTGAEIDAIAALQGLGLEDIEIVNVAELPGGDDPTALDEALTRNEAEVAELHDALMGNTAVMEALAQNDVEVEDVVAVNVMDAGHVLVFHRPTAEEQVPR